MFHNLGEPTEAALKVLVEKFGTSDPDYNKKINFVPDADKLKTMSVHDKSQRNMRVNEYIEGLYRKVCVNLDKVFDMNN